jgi:hypothetical protein
MSNINDGTLDMDRCPHCAIAKPLLVRIHAFETANSKNTNKRLWGVYKCTTCGGALLGSAQVNPRNSNPNILDIYPHSEKQPASLPVKASSFLSQAMESLHAPSGAIMLCASSVDAMLKEKNYKQGSLYTRIDQAAKDGVITKDMAEWAHDVRLDANDERHADENATLPETDDAKRCIEFTKAFGIYLYTLPKMVADGRSRATSTTETASS